MARTVKQPDIRKQELLEIGVKLYFKEGEKGISIQHVVKQANVATGLFYYYFKSKDEFLDEALNYHVGKEISYFELILENSTLTACQKLNAILDAYSEYANKMAPFRLARSFHTESHYVLTEKWIARLKDAVETLLIQGLSENVFDVGDISVTAGFILSGLLVAFDAGTEISKDTLAELKRLVNKILKR